MSVKAGPKIVKDGLIFDLDAAVSRSYSGSGITANALIGGIGGTLVNGVGFTSANSGSFVFDGTNDYINIVPSGTSFTYNRSAFTVAGFTYMTSLPTSFYGVILAKWNTGAGNDNEFNFNTTAGDIFRLSVDFDDSLTPDAQSNDVVFSTTTVVANTWYYVAATFDNGVMKIYVNGVLENTVTSSYTTVKTSINSSLDIGRFGIYYSIGRRGLVQLYNRALSATEIRQNFNATKRRYGL